MTYLDRCQIAYDQLEPCDLERLISPEVKEKKYAKDHLENVLYWLYKSTEFDEIMFERALEELCAYFDMPLPSDFMKRKVT